MLNESIQLYVLGLVRRVFGHVLVRRVFGRVFDTTCA